MKDNKIRGSDLWFIAGAAQWILYNNLKLLKYKLISIKITSLNESVYNTFNIFYI